MEEFKIIELMPIIQWSFATATGILIVILAFFLIHFYRKRLQAMDPLNRDVGDLVNQKTALESDVDTIKDWIASQKDELQRLEAERQEQEIIRAEIQRLEQEASKKEEDNKKLRDEVGSLENQQHMLVHSMEKLEKERSELEKDIKSLGKSSTDSAASLKKIEKELKKLEEEQSKVKADIDEGKLKIKAQEKELKKLSDELQSEIEKSKEMQKTIDSKQEELAELEKSQKKKQDEVNSLEHNRIDLEARVQTLDQKMKKTGQMPVEAFDQLNVPFIEKVETQGNDVSESDALEKLYKLTLNSGFEIPHRLQKAFHTSLKTSDISCLTVMAGVSGTGKSAFPKLYSQAMGLNFLPLAVEPRWDSPQDLFGFLNYMENRYEATSLGRSLVQFNNSPYNSENANLKDQMLLVLLDEMNLARIEYYFSEFLSKLEMRRNADIKNISDYQMVSTEIYAGQESNEDQEETKPIYLYGGTNVLFVGTMNEDETTQSLSDKVIDRANVLYFGKPDKLKAQEQNIIDRSDWRPISFDNWNNWIIDINENAVKKFEDIEQRLNDINTTLSNLGRPFGWRTYKAMMSYIINHPDSSADGANGMGPLSDQIAMRVMPKLKGLDLNEYGDVFTRLKNQISDMDDDVLIDAFTKAQSSSMGFFDWRGISW
jgi:septal ring factor EnvC (AmiA/AmiB activator)